MDVEGGNISVKLSSDQGNIDTAPITPAIIVMATILEALYEEADITDGVRMRAH